MEERKIKVLVVDDEYNTRLLLSEELTEEGYDVLLAGTGEEGMRILGEQNPDVVVLDMRLPDIDWRTSLSTIREMNRDIPIIIFSAYGTYKQDFSVWAADFYVVKSSDLSELKESIRKAVRRREER